MGQKLQNILIAVPTCVQEGCDEYNGIMRFIREVSPPWHIILDRLAGWRPAHDGPQKFSAAILNGACSLGMLKAYCRMRMPIAAVDWRHAAIGRGHRDLVRIDADNGKIGRLAASTLWKTSNFASYAFLPIAEACTWSTCRGRAYVDALRRHDIKAQRLQPKGDLEKQLKRLPKPAAIFAANDIAGAHVLNAAAASKISVPEDASVLGVDNEALTCFHTIPPLASIQPDFEEAGYMAAAAVHAMLSHNPVKSRQTYPIRQVIVRQSMEPARSAGRLVQRALAIIRDPHSPVRNINQIAHQLGVSRRLLDQRFREIQSCSVLEAIHDARFEQVCTLLKTTALPITEICAVSQLGAGTYPLQAFKKRFGMSMSKYRRNAVSPRVQ